MDRRYQCVGRWAAAAQVISQFEEKEKKRKTGEKKPVCEVERWEGAGEEERGRLYW